MSSSASNPPEDSPWTPEEVSPSSGFSEGKREITEGFRKIGDGASEVVCGLILLLLLIISRRDDGEEDRSKEAAARKEEWDKLSASVQRKFDESDVTEDDVDDAIEWARSQ
ncbi:hypothetical protein [Salinigranum marinum]|uniref:hypothetical protein n=1 Tax=Salinigranum marinum TaxID=1515595 RepID=UPI002989D34A|nr:hypothetical protein [Salinigranum marinum]